ncbi:transporter substrate-binding domain-containing protein [Brevibacillus laterosporus]|uniref:transporter substrate-binding domain-containing protein n=1 Tax=Brevibacillus laterosporus TaxID=1465 RepID=UPI00264C8896|nr:transporter substrate-binding domain-containing protein [Brevibacillus laterosporus]MDN9010390.1 transporter substrate-binding domain-containing protein [Brevibacillus laterosporus]MDO0941277.1 transporter substrate-binding domain-containing protein [Brevibacillus laterosporus]
MRKSTKSFAALALSTLLSVSLLTGCGSASQDSGNAANKNTDQAAAKTLTMFTSADYYPYEFHETKDGNDQIVGMDIDIATYIAKELGYELKVVDTDFNGLVPALQSKRADFVMAGMSTSPERKKNVDFSNNYYEAKNTLVSKKDSPITKPEQLSGKRLAVQIGSMQEKAAQVIAKEINGVEVVSLNKMGEIIQEVVTGRSAAAVVENTIAQGFLEKNPGLQSTVMTTNNTEGYAIAFPKGSEHVEKFNEILKKMEENGEMDKLIKKWLGQ